LQNARQNGLCMIRHPAPNELAAYARLTAQGEPGQPLIVSGQVFAPTGEQPAAGVTVYAYNTDTEGYYGENQREFPPRIYGWMKTDADGRFEVRTILPGHYPNMQIPAHIHFSFWGAGYPLQWVDDLRFEGDRYLTPAMLEESARGGDFRTIQPLVKGENGMLRCNYKIKLQQRTNFA
jgi:protocatechuate 3,4-dioxygenase beta subunit